MKEFPFSKLVFTHFFANLLTLAAIVGLWFAWQAWQAPERARLEGQARIEHARQQAELSRQLEDMRQQIAETEALLAAKDAARPLR